MIKRNFVAGERKLLSPNKSIYSGLLFLIFFTVSTLSFSQVKFSAVSSNTQIGRNEYLKIQYIVENASDVDEIVPPSFKNFSIVRGPIRQSSTSIINGAVNQSVGLEFVLKPNATGTFTLPPAIAKVNGKSLRSNSLKVKITNNSSLSSGGISVSPFSNITKDVLRVPPIHQYDDYILHNGENVSGKIAKNLFVKLEVNKTSCYVGEPIVATYKLYTRLKSESNLTKTPSFNGFSVSEMKVPDNYTTTTERYNAREYSVYTLRKVQLYPLQPGNVELGPVEVENHITFIKAEYANTKNGDIFYDMIRDFVDANTPANGMEVQKVTLQSKPLNITVKPLPVLNQPVDFKGAVGDFTIKAGIEKNSITTDEAGNLTIAITGKGNIPMINAPAIFWPRGIEVFDAKTEENIDKTMVPLHGEKIFNYPFTLTTPGNYIIPAVSFSYFDIITKTYKTIATEPVTIDVKKGKENTALTPGQLKTSTAGKGATGKYSQPMWFWLLFCIAIGVTALAIWFSAKPGRKKALSVLPIPAIPIDKNVEDSTKPADELIPQNPLQEAKEMLLDNQGNNFYYALNNCLKKYLAFKLNFPEKEFSKKKINEILDTLNVGVGTTLMLSSLLENIELNLYAPPSSVQEVQKVYENACEVVALLDKQIA